MTSYSAIQNPHVLARLARGGPLADRLAECLKSCDATPDEARQARLELPSAIRRASKAPVQEPLPLLNKDANA